MVVIYSEFVTKLAQDYSSLLPDSLPFLAEILEDSDTKVEEAAHLLVKTIEEVTGESMDKYLWEECPVRSWEEEGFATPRLSFSRF